MPTGLALAAESAAAIGREPADRDQGSAAAIDLVQAAESAAAMGQATVGPDSAVVIGLGLAAELVAAIGRERVGRGLDSAVAIGRGPAVIAPVSVDRGSEGVIDRGLAIIDRGSVDRGSEGVIDRGLAIIDRGSVDLALGVAIGLDPAVTGRVSADRGSAGAIARGLAIIDRGSVDRGSGMVIVLHGRAIGPEAGGAANSGQASEIGQGGQEIGRDTQAETVALPAEIVPDGPAIAQEMDRAISGQATSGISAITLELSTGPTMVGTLTLTTVAAAEAAGVAATGG